MKLAQGSLEAPLRADAANVTAAGQAAAGGGTHRGQEGWGGALSVDYLLKGAGVPHHSAQSPTRRQRHPLEIEPPNRELVSFCEVYSYYPQAKVDFAFARRNLLKLTECILNPDLAAIV